MYKFRNLCKKLAAPVLGAAVVVAGSALPSQAAILDFSGVATAVTAELTPALTSAMPIVGTLMAVAVGYKLFRRFVK